MASGKTKATRALTFAKEGTLLNGETLAPIDAAGDCHAPGGKFGVKDCQNHASATYRAYADAKYAYTSAGDLPVTFYVLGGLAVAAVALFIALRHK